MTPVALWTGRLPGLRRIPGRSPLVGAVGFAAMGFAGAIGVFGEAGPWISAATSLFVGWTILRHRWPTALPPGLSAHERPQGPDERAVSVGFRVEGALLGWDVGILWFEKGGIGFVGRTVAFVLPRAMMAGVPEPSAWRSTLRAPQMVAKVFDTTLDIVPLAREINAQMTLARIEALPDRITSETILPPTRLHPDLIARGQSVRDRLPILYGLFLTLGLTTLATQSSLSPGGLGSNFAAAVGLLTCLAILAFGTVPPASVRARLPSEPRRR